MVIRQACQLLRRAAKKPRQPSAPLDNAGANGAALQITELLEPMSTDEIIECLGSCGATWEIAAMRLYRCTPWLNTPVETKRLEAARAAMADWKAYTHACQAGTTRTVVPVVLPSVRRRSRGGGRKIGEMAGGHETTAPAMPRPSQSPKEVVGGSPPPIGNVARRRMFDMRAILE
jgi:hypothetical protein